MLSRVSRVERGTHALQVGRADGQFADGRRLRALVGRRARRLLTLQLQQGVILLLGERRPLRAGGRTRRSERRQTMTHECQTYSSSFPPSPPLWCCIRCRLSTRPVVSPLPPSPASPPLPPLPALPPSLLPPSPPHLQYPTQQHAVRLVLYPVSPQHQAHHRDEHLVLAAQLPDQRRERVHRDRPQLRRPVERPDERVEDARRVVRQVKGRRELVDRLQRRPGGANENRPTTVNLVLVVDKSSQLFGHSAV